MGAEFLMGILASLLATLIAWIIKNAIKLSEYRSGMTGTWEVSIYDEIGNIIKKDTMLIKHNRKTGEINGKEYREIPYEQRHREWEINGRMSGKIIMIIAFATEEINSHACGCLRLIEDGFFSGYYLKCNNKTSKIEKIKVKMKKCKGKWR